MTAAVAEPAVRADPAPNPIHVGTCGPRVGWSTVNASEALPGVVTPLTWSFFGDNVERAMRGAFADMGVLREAECVAPADPDKRLWALWYGRAAGNLDTFRFVGDRTPGTSGAAVEQQIFGASRPDLPDRPVRSRYPVVAARLPVNAVRVGGRLREHSAAITRWWGAAVAEPGLDRVAAQALLREACERHEAVMRPHTFAAMLCQGLYDQVCELAAAAGTPGLETHLVTGYGDMAETAVAADLWAVSRDELTLAAFVARHGFHGPDEGELAARVWRMRPAPLTALVASYRALPAERDPRRLEAQRAQERRAAEARLLAALPRLGRARARVTLAVAARLIPLRGVGKAAFLRCADVARVAATALGADLHARGLLDDPHDVFWLTVPELLRAEPDPGTAELARARRAVSAAYDELELPDVFVGPPVPRPRDTSNLDADEPITGTPVSPGVVEGPVRLVLDLEADAEVHDGEVLVCRTTDPGWASLMVIAAALVIDIGGAISHGAIVARELGVPCVIGTGDGTRRLRTGDRVRVDGDAGTVTLLARAGDPSSSDHHEEDVSMSEPDLAGRDLAVLRALGLKGRAEAGLLGQVTGLQDIEVYAVLTGAEASEQIKQARDAYRLTPEGRQAVAAGLKAERAGLDAAALEAGYARFDAPNDRLKVLMTAWQLRDGEPNLHDDADYDGGVAAELVALHADVAPLVADLVALAPRLAPVPGRLQHAADRVAAGEHAWIAKPLLDSWHTVWFELHEELIALLGRTRQAEAEAGRAL